MKRKSYSRYPKTKRWQGKRWTIMKLAGYNVGSVKRDARRRCITRHINVSVENDSVALVNPKTESIIFAIQTNFLDTLNLNI